MTTAERDESFPADQVLTADEVADFFLSQANGEGSQTQPMTNLRLQKLLYYAQAWGLALNDEPLFEEDVEAWVHGPVVPSIYRKYRAHGNRRLSTETAVSPRLSASQQRVLTSVWKSYGGLSAARLRNMTHREDPWVKAREPYADDENCNAPITPAIMREYFVRRLERDREKRLARQLAAYARQPTTDEERTIAELSLEQLRTAS